jgi:hypothetical protein
MSVMTKMLFPVGLAAAIGLFALSSQAWPELVKLKVCDAVSNETLAQLYGSEALKTSGRYFWVNPEDIQLMVPSENKGCTRVNLSNGRQLKVQGSPDFVYCEMYHSPLCKSEQP